MIRLVTAMAVPALLAACTPPPDEVQAATLFDALQAYCGQAFEGAVASEDPRDADWAGQTLTMHVRECSDNEIRIPLHVGEDRSRTWVVSRTEAGFRLKHDHRHEDGSEDVLTQYGGDSSTVSDSRVEFPADPFSRDLFEREGIPASSENVWLMQIEGESFTYGLDRPGRTFRAVFDLSTPVDAPPAPWGFED
ncbi:hypothetical protein V0U79_03860 [Hyphobacterium sp. HN65]|uniref:Lipoprotein n=1 Tax=Hyphobacterium lacteum TaxID=3116575 RepID=A0ABU7LPF2_9PROT|nr:hypothetical protein [Hyphobacterium sp. HN65]MEE2525489.1 hypothetical protein [Hyphobacterium sp. HN65]